MIIPKATLLPCESNILLSMIKYVGSVQKVYAKSFLIKIGNLIMFYTEIP